MSKDTRYQRHTISIPVGDSFCTAWLHMPTGVQRPPVVVMGHGMGATREMRLDAYAERFAARGIASIAFTYRNFGDSGGTHRQELNVKDQLRDWEEVLAHARGRDDVDTSRIAVWGTSFGGGHAITIASRHPDLVAAVAQCPFTDGLLTALRLSPFESLRLQGKFIRDLVATVTRREPVYLPLAGAPGDVAIMTAPDALPGYQSLVPDGGTWVNSTRARAIPRLLRYRPGRSTKKIQIPILFCISSTDTVAPAGPTLKYARRAPHGVVQTYEAGHFDFYTGQPFEQLVAEQIDFLAKHMSTQPTGGAR
ncbi:alpha/beta hydrolase [Antrihabitans stalactiti]|uniref:Alpha/beta hydrolase n=1 Tax=Antrihabitans stalactiti TaxID=2584121 RepID=A0A848KQ49_9NOCA|nr:alpha/beta hydrolase [Antrihabitans stalactiti]NMN98410.1 alpha/beta hydrolase [Antrihabitans stalactiti]